MIDGGWLIMDGELRGSGGSRNSLVEVLVPETAWILGGGFRVEVDDG